MVMSTADLGSAYKTEKRAQKLKKVKVYRKVKRRKRK